MAIGESVPSSVLPSTMRKAFMRSAAARFPPSGCMPQDDKCDDVLSRSTSQACRLQPCRTGKAMPPKLLQHSAFRARALLLCAFACVALP